MLYIYKHEIIQLRLAQNSMDFLDHKLKYKPIYFQVMHMCIVVYKCSIHNLNANIINLLHWIEMERF